MEMEQETQRDSDAMLWEIQEHFVNTIREKISRLRPSHCSTYNCIYTVEARLGSLKDEAFTPRLVSVGPYHYGKPHLQFMEYRKLRYLKSFLRRDVDIVNIINFIVNHETVIGQYYQDESKFSWKEFCEMILLDSVFVLELLLENYFRPETAVDNKYQWMSIELLRDMILLENQLPLFVLQEIYDQNIFRTAVSNCRFGDLIHQYLKATGNVPEWDIQVLPTGSIRPRHLVEYLWMSQVNKVTGEKNSFKGRAPSSTELFKHDYSRCATDMLEAGILFGSDTRSHLLQISFRRGILRIPLLKVNQTTETLFRNLIAFERCEHRFPRYICEYVTFMNSLIRTTEDVDVLIRYGIIEDSFGRNDQIVELFHNLCKATSMTRTIYFSKILLEVNKYSRNFLRQWMATHRWKARWSGWMVMLRRDYFNNPWAGISVFAAILALVLTVVQTLCSIMSTNN